MNSNDIRVLAHDEQAFKVYVITRLETIDGRLGKLESEQKELREGQKELRAEQKELREGQKELRAEQKELRADQKELRAEIGVIQKNQAVLSEQIANLQYNFNVWLPVLAVLVTFIGVFAPLFIHRKKEDTPKPENSSVLTYRDVQDMIDRSLRLKGD